MSQAKGRLLLARANLYAVTNDLIDACTRYERISGLKPSENLVPVSNPRNLPKTRINAIDHALSHHPMLESAIADVAEATAQYKATGANFLPQLDLVLNAHHDRNIDGASGPNDQAAAMLRLHYNIFNGGADHAKRKETAYQIEQALDIRDRTIDEIVEQLKFSWSMYRTSQKRIPTLHAYENESYKTVFAYRRQFKLSKRTLVDLLDTENELFAARNAYINEHYRHLSAKYRLLNNMGEFP